MDRLIFNAVASLNDKAVSRQGMVNELSNVSTVGFKRSMDVAMQSVKAQGQGFDSRYQSRLVIKDLIELNPGPVMVTGNELDIALQDRAVLGVQAPNGELAFTRRGDLRVNVNGVLENGSGHVVLGANGPISVPPGFQVRVAPDGNVYAADPAQAGPVAEQLIDQLLMRDASETPLTRRADGLFRVADAEPGTDFAGGPTVPRVVPGALEASNVSPVDALTRLIDHSRSFEAQVRIVKEIKGIDESGASMMRQG